MKASLHPGVRASSFFGEDGDDHYPGKGMPFISPPICKPPFDVCMHLYPPVSFCVTKESMQALYEMEEPGRIGGFLIR